jgi:hypothetical protein
MPTYAELAKLIKEELEEKDARLPSAVEDITERFRERGAIDLPASIKALVKALAEAREVVVVAAKAARKVAAKKESKGHPKDHELSAIEGFQAAPRT